MKPLAFLLRALVLPAVSAFVTLPAQAQDGALSQLYAARPPAGSSFVRVVNPTTETLLVQVAGGPAQRIGP